MSTMSVIDEVNEVVRRHVNSEMEAILTSNEKIGLDPRCGVVYVDSESIAVDKSCDRALQYYGGFEYVDKDKRVELGDYVFYLAEDDRVRDHLDRYYGVAFGLDYYPSSRDFEDDDDEE